MTGRRRRSATPYRAHGGLSCCCCRMTPAVRVRGQLRVALFSSSALTTTFLPVFLIGALSDSIRTELGFTTTAIGATVTVLFLSASLAAMPVGRLVETVGAAFALRTGVVLSGLSAVGIGAFATTWWHVAVPLAAVGVAMAMIDTGAARWFADAVPTSGLGVAFGIKEASVPVAALLAGLALPTVALNIGWRATFVAAAGVAAVVLVALRSRATPGEGVPLVGMTNPLSPVGTVAVMPLAVGVAFGAGAATAAATFLVPSATDSGVSPQAAGFLLAAASAGSVAVRIKAGRWADREHTAPLRAVALMLALGGTGAALVASRAPLLVIAGSVLVLAFGWGWTGLTYLVVVRARPGAPAAAAGAVLTGLTAGGALGPLIFGALAERGSYTFAWSVTVVAFGIACATVRSSDRTVRPNVSRPR
jgi:MFS family permease